MSDPTTQQGRIPVALGDGNGNVRIPGTNRVWCRPLSDGGEPQPAILSVETTENDARLPPEGTLLQAEWMEEATERVLRIIPSSLPA
jgi:hypothetical protein